MNEDERDQMVDDATHVALDVFSIHRVDVPEHEMFALNDYLTALARRLT